ncbi:MAG: hypothetical protein OXB86_03310 [Bdellovibrionales bacterium]|nr:hypothetical protein [Bdellovibrionales bacterium]
MRFATERLSAASVSSSCSFLTLNLWVLIRSRICAKAELLFDPCRLL